MYDSYQDQVYETLPSCGTVDKMLITLAKGVMCGTGNIFSGDRSMHLNLSSHPFPLSLQPYHTPSPPQPPTGPENSLQCTS